MEYSNHHKFLLYLGNTSYIAKGEDACEDLVAFAEENLPKLLASNGLKLEGDIYSNREEEFWKGVITDGLVNDDSTNEERDYAGMMMNALKYYKGFIHFDKTADYKKEFKKKLQREQARAKSTLQKEGKKETFEDKCVPEEEGAPRQEGAVSQVSVTKYERNPEHRRLVLERDKYECQICHMNFEKVYGEIGKQFIEVHHLFPVCNMGEDYVFDPLDPEKGLVCLCSNCHSMIHRGGEYKIINGDRKMVPMTLEALREEYKKNNPDK